MNNILMNAPMALATQQGIKTQTRRVVTEKHDYVGNDGNLYIERTDGYGGFAKPWMVSTKYKIGQVLWLREPAKIIEHAGVTTWTADKIPNITYEYLSDNSFNCIDIPSRFVPIPKWLINCQGIPNGCIREMARTFICITDIRVDRLNDISEEDCLREGIRKLSKDGEVFKYCFYDHKDYSSTPWTDMKRNPKEAFLDLWESISGEDSFDNRWVWVLEFEVISKEEALSESKS